MDYASLSWTAYTNDTCTIYLLDKEGANYFLRIRRLKSIRRALAYLTYYYDKGPNPYIIKYFNLATYIIYYKPFNLPNRV